MGTNLITAKNCPAFGGVYKLSAVLEKDAWIPKIKLSENPKKITNPGNKTVYRIYEKDSGKIKADLIALADEVFSSKDPLLLFDPNATWKKTVLKPDTYTIKELLIPIFENGTCVYQCPSSMEIKAYCSKQKESLWDETKRLVNPNEVYVDLSKKLFDLKNSLLNSR